MNDLDARLLQAHAQGDNDALITLYREAAAESNDPQAIGFYLTHAQVFALERGDPQAATLRQTLIEMGREEPLFPPHV